MAEPAAPPTASELRTAAARLAAEMDRARLFQAAAYAAMAADAAGRARLGEEAMRTDVDLDFRVDEYDRVWIIREGDCQIIGRRHAVCAEMTRFLASGVLQEGAG
ncbi:MAG: hypothetical protein JO013_12260 [Alphaproteobacteria bacterium]|nr:hypothetical protein [Alphaproteobacteria bacterium]